MHFGNVVTATRPRVPRALRRICAAAAAVTAIGLALLAPMDASATTTMPDHCRSNWTLAAYSDGAWSRAITLSNGTVIGYVKNARSTSCANAWFAHFALSNTSYTIDVSVWHPNESSVGIWSGPWTSWQDTPPIDSRRGVQNCSGAQIYKRNGPYVRWQFFGCWTG